MKMKKMKMLPRLTKKEMRAIRFYIMALPVWANIRDEKLDTARRSFRVRYLSPLTSDRLVRYLRSKYGIRATKYDTKLAHRPNEYIITYYRAAVRFMYVSATEDLPTGQETPTPSLKFKLSW